MGDTNPTLTIHLGWAEVTDFVNVETHRAIGMSEDKATIKLWVDALKSPGLSFAGEVQITATEGGRVYPLFTGLVDRVSLAGDGVACIELIGLHRDLATSLMGGLVVGKGTGKVEMVYSLMRQAGVPEERIKFDGWKPGPEEQFIVAAPVAALSVSGARQVGEVAFTNDIPVEMDLTGDSPLIPEFEKASCWGWVTVSALTLVEAEGAGIAKLLAALDEVRAFAYYSYPVMNGEVKPFEWRHTQARPQLASVTYVGAVASERRWLRDRVDTSRLETFDLDDLVLRANIELGAARPVKRQLDRALAEWHLSIDASTEAARLAHLWRALECYVAGAKTESGKSTRLFSKQELSVAAGSLRSATAWSEGQRARLDELVGRLNEPPLLARIRATLSADEIDIVDAEFDALVATRSMRNDLEHGGSLTAAQHRAVDLAVAIANRIIVEAVVNSRRSDRPAG
jgi:hypothetical protein